MALLSTRRRQHPPVQKGTRAMKFILPTGIGDSLWALVKIQSIRDTLDPAGKIDVTLVGGNHHIDSRAVDFVRRFQFVDSVTVQPFSIHQEGDLTYFDGTYRYLEDGRYTILGQPYVMLIPNADLERGERLESWLPRYAPNWRIFDDFSITP